MRGHSSPIYFPLSPFLLVLIGSKDHRAPQSDGCCWLLNSTVLKPTVTMNTTSFIFSVKVALLSTAVLSTAVMAKLIFPSFLHFASYEVPRMYSSALSWLTPPYLYFVVNCIIITIAASTRFHGPSSDDSEQLKTTQQADIVVQTQFEMVSEEETKVKVAPPEEYGVAEPFGEVVVGASVPVTEEVENNKKKKEEEEEDFVISRSNWTPPSRRVSGEFSGEEKPPVSSRFGSRKSIRASPEGKVLGVSRPKRNETLESTWKMITDGRAPPLARHLKKSDTWETQGRARREQSPMKKSETLNERGAAGGGGALLSPGSSGGSGRLRKEPSLSQDELNRRVEAFINKFNEEMRSQRQESVYNYLNMVDRGTR